MLRRVLVESADGVLGHDGIRDGSDLLRGGAQVSYLPILREP